MDALGRRLEREFALRRTQASGFRGGAAARSSMSVYVRPYLLLMLAGGWASWSSLHAETWRISSSRALLSREREVAVRVCARGGPLSAHRATALSPRVLLLALLGGSLAVLMTCALAGTAALTDAVAMPLPPWMHIVGSTAGPAFFLAGVALGHGYRGGAPVPALVPGAISSGVRSNRRWRTLGSSASAAQPQWLRNAVWWSPKWRCVRPARRRRASWCDSVWLDSRPGRPRGLRHRAVC